MIPFNVPPYAGREDEYVLEAIHNHKICGDGPFTKRCHAALEEMTGTGKALLTTSGSSALEMAAILCDVGPGDEVILPSFTFSSTANAFALRGATLVFADICPDTMNGKEIMMGAQLTVRESQVAVFVNEGQLADVYQPGRYELSTQNMPIMTALKAWKFGFNSPFKSDVYFINTKQFLDRKWGTSNPVMMRDTEFGMISLQVSLKTSR